jgi:hypothetical protein
MRQAWCLLCLLRASYWFLAWFTLRPWRWRRYISPKRWMTFTRRYIEEDRARPDHCCENINAIALKYARTYSFRRNCDSSVDITTRLRAGRPRNGGSWSGKRFFFLLLYPDRLWGPPSHIYNGYGGGGGCFVGSKSAGAWSWPLTTTNCLGQKWWSYTSTPPYVFNVWCLIN